MELKEAKLFPPLKIWLNNQGFKVYGEVRGIDVIADNHDRQIAFELKMSCTAKVIRQACSAKGWTGEAYIVVPTTPRKEKISFIQKLELGLIKISGDEVTVLVEPKRSKAYRRLDFTDWTEAETAGIPVLKGMGPGQQCLIAIRAYVSNNPSATWMEIHKNVPNHYSNPRSMCQSMIQHQGFYLSSITKSHKKK